jgi:hypothetical protein
MKAEGSVSSGSLLRLASRRNELSIQGFWRGQWTKKRGGVVELVRGALWRAGISAGQEGSMHESNRKQGPESPPGQSQQLTLALRHLQSLVFVKEQA